MTSAVLTTLAGAATKAAAIDSAAARRATACAGGRMVWRIWGYSRPLVLGDLAAARENLLQAIEHYREADFRGVPEAFYAGNDALIFAGINEWLLGYPSQRMSARGGPNGYALSWSSSVPEGHFPTVGLRKEWRSTGLNVLLAPGSSSTPRGPWKTDPAPRRGTSDPA